jgi:ribose transport system substrate-binding protein
VAEVAPSIKVLDVVDVQGDFAVAVNKTEAILQAYPNLKGILPFQRKALLRRPLY